MRTKLVMTNSSAMLAASSINQDLIIHASRAMIQHDDLLFPGLFELTSIVLVKVNNKDPVGFTGLMAAVLKQARIDALAGDQEAIDWLAGDLCFDMCFALRFNHKNVIAWLQKERISQ